MISSEISIPDLSKYTAFQIKKYIFLRVSEVNEVPINSHIHIGCLDDIQTALKPLKKSEKNCNKFF